MSSNGDSSSQKRKTILSIAYPFTKVGPDAVGGSEQILTILDEALTRAGHRSLVIAAEGSKVAGTLIASPRARGDLTPRVREEGQRIHSRLIREILSRYRVDLIHMHSLDFHRYLPEDDEVPVLATLHLPPDWYPPEIFRMQRDNFYLNCVSSSQQRSCPSTRCLLEAVPNGVHVEKLMSNGAVKGNYALSLGRICPEKGYEVAVRAAKKARTQLILAGEIFPYRLHTEYFTTVLEPLLDRSRRFIGPVGFRAKRRLLAEARCLIVPSRVAETSSLVTMEALAAGTPVIAFPVGALPELIEHGRTGYIVSNEEEMVEAIRSVSKLRPEDCHMAARTRFSAAAMTGRYFDVYSRILRQAERKIPAARHSSGLSWLMEWGRGNGAIDMLPFDPITAGRRLAATTKR